MTTRRRFLVGSAAALSAAPLGLQAQAQGAFAQVDAVVAAQVAKLGGSGMIAVVKDRRLVHTAGFGGMNPKDRYRVFSLSKSITGLAIAKLAAAGKLDLDQPIARYIGAALKKYGPPADSRVADVTVRQTMIHMAGFASNEREDDPTILGKDRFVPPKGRERDPRSWRKEDVLPGILKRTLDAAPGTQYIYSNAGYVILGLIVEAASGVGYEDYCREAVFKPAGLPLPTVEPDRRYVDSVSGWQMTPAEVMKMWAVYEPGDTRVLTPQMRQQIFAPTPAFINEQRRSYYTYGICIQEFRPGSHIWFHTGRNQFGPQEQQLVTFATHGPTISMVWAIRPALNLQGLTALDRDLWVALRAVTDWPAHDLYPQHGF
jgi:CubicO group peptidase (beta-lactamase class C family)